MELIFNIKDQYSNCEQHLLYPSAFKLRKSVIPTQQCHAGTTGSEKFEA
ncbi:hypothetical protein LDG_7539 [Legionella drancourtii LLAP12]|uniref:Uncharacterized protein n=1 Tax=Legionella drancourtii LLAP12 TaxID=658187 RepID=G9EQJ2_9GAMM|nr:hypothetical protein LDG_7539 [Legionella drancourtii LLAP12]